MEPILGQVHPTARIRQMRRKPCDYRRRGLRGSYLRYQRGFPQSAF